MELIAILAVAGISCDGVHASDPRQVQSERISSMRTVEAPELIASAGKEGSCGKCGKCGANSCGANYYAHLKQQKQHSAQMRRVRKRLQAKKAPAVVQNGGSNQPGAGTVSSSTTNQ